MCEYELSDQFCRHMAAAVLHTTESKVDSKAVQRLRYFLEQDGRCVYCGKPFGNLSNVLVNDDNSTEVEHILPRARSNDDTWSNKVLAHAKCNSAKGCRAPYEYLTGPRWKPFVHRVHNMKYLPQEKKDKLLNIWFGQMDILQQLVSVVGKEAAISDLLDFIDDALDYVDIES